MVSTPIGVVGGSYGTAITVLLLATLWIWRHTETLNEESYQKRIQELNNEYWSEVSNSLTDLHLEIGDYVDGYETDGGEDVPREELVLDIIEDKIDPEDLEDVVIDLSRVGDPNSAYQSYKKKYERCYVHLSKAMAWVIASGVAFVAAVVLTDSPFGTGPMFVEILLFVPALVHILDARTNFNAARSCRSRFNEMWAEYRSEIPEPRYNF